jgi:hypothetical protein
MPCACARACAFAAQPLGGERHAPVPARDRHAQALQRRRGHRLRGESRVRRLLNPVQHLLYRMSLNYVSPVQAWYTCYISCDSTMSVTSNLVHLLHVMSLNMFVQFNRGTCYISLTHVSSVQSCHTCCIPRHSTMSVQFNLDVLSVSHASLEYVGLCKQRGALGAALC